jgi:5-methylcytosine-specific restriction protein B
MQSEDDSRIVMVQFHQSYSYEDFIQGFRPSGTGAFSLQNGTFYDFCTKARSDPQQKYMFIIDEINRGNLSKILGELMMLIEPDKRGEKYSLPLIYSPGEKFFCPPNVHLIGTMNTADRSLAMVDYALRRRFGFVDLKPEFESQAFTEYLAVNGVAPGIANRIVQQMTLLNDKIKEHKDLGKGYQIGHSYFCPPSEFSPRDTASYEEWYQDVIKLDVIPLLEEYLFDDPTTLGNWKQILLA